MDKIERLTILRERVEEAQELVTECQARMGWDWEFDDFWDEWAYERAMEDFERAREELEAFEKAHEGQTEGVVRSTETLYAAPRLLAPSPARVLAVDHELLVRLAKHPEIVYDLQPRQLELVVANILEDLGFEIELTPVTRDGGKDIIARLSKAGFTFTTFVECKKHPPQNPVTVHVVRQVYGVQQAEGADRSLIVTTSRFTSDAREYRRLIAREMSLRDYEGLKEWLSRYAPRDATSNSRSRR